MCAVMMLVWRARRRRRRRSCRQQQNKTTHKQHQSPAAALRAPDAARFGKLVDPFPLHTEMVKVNGVECVFLFLLRCLLRTHDPERERVNKQPPTKTTPQKGCTACRRGAATAAAR